MCGAGRRLNRYKRLIQILDTVTQLLHYLNNVIHHVSTRRRARCEAGRLNSFRTAARCGLARPGERAAWARQRPRGGRPGSRGSAADVSAPPPSGPPPTGSSSDFEGAAREERGKGNFPKTRAHPVLSLCYCIFGIMFTGFSICGSTCRTMLRGFRLLNCTLTIGSRCRNKCILNIKTSKKLSTAHS